MTGSLKHSKFHLRGLPLPGARLIVVPLLVRISSLKFTEMIKLKSAFSNIRIRHYMKIGAADGVLKKIMSLNSLEQGALVSVQ